MNSSPSHESIREIFESELTIAGGRLTDAFDDRHRLFLRGTLPEHAEIRPADRIQAGVALRSTDDEIVIHPYTFRQVCSNGAIFVHAVQTQALERISADSPPWETMEVCDRLREVVRACANPVAFELAASQTRTAAHSAAVTLISLMPMLSRLPQHAAAALLQQIAERFSQDSDRTAYGLMNAVTATARDTKDPDLRWKLEEMGGAMIARLKPPTTRSGPALKLSAVS